MNFRKKFDRVIEVNDSLVCVGLDTDAEKIPLHLRGKSGSIFVFNKAIIDATADLVCAFKPNIAFYEAGGLEGLKQLKKTIEYIKLKYSKVPVILDAKRGDIGSTNRMYAKAVFEHWGVDGVTVTANLGLDSLKPFFAYQDKLVILLLRTSNPDAKVFQGVKVSSATNSGKGEPFYLHMAKKVKLWRQVNLGIFVGATYPKELKAVREIFPNLIFLSAGLGAQGGDVKKAVLAGIDKKGKGIMFNASRSIIYASGGRDFDKKAREETERLKKEINKVRKRRE